MLEIESFVYKPQHPFDTLVYFPTFVIPQRPMPKLIRKPRSSTKPILRNVVNLDLEPKAKMSQKMKKNERKKQGLV